MIAEIVKTHMAESKEKNGEEMKSLFDKISSYNLFNNLFPGILFVCLSKEFLSYNLIQENLLIGVFLYYFLGMIVSRIGSIIIEPILKKINFVQFSDYGHYILASKNDEKIELFTEVSNMYRTIVSLFLCLLMLKVYKHFEVNWNIPQRLTSLIAIVGVLILFLFSYRKQTAFITKRVKNHINSPTP